MSIFVIVIVCYALIGAVLGAISTLDSVQEWLFGEVDPLNAFEFLLIVALGMVLWPFLVRNALVVFLYDVR